MRQERLPRYPSASNYNQPEQRQSKTNEAHAIVNNCLLTFFCRLLFVYLVGLLVLMPLMHQQTILDLYRLTIPALKFTNLLPTGRTASHVTPTRPPNIELDRLFLLVWGCPMLLQA